MSNSPKILSSAFWKAIIILTVSINCLSSCSWISRQTFGYIGEECKTHAYIDNRLPEFITQRFGNKSQTRIGIIPFTVPANFSGWGNLRPDWGYEFAVQLHQQLLKTAELPIIQVLDRRDWPGKSEEFSSGNYGAIQSAKNAGFDLVIVGILEPLRNANSISILSKVIETESGITVWYGKAEVFSYRPEIERSTAYLNVSSHRPDLVYTADMANELSKCLAQRIVYEAKE